MKQQIGSRELKLRLGAYLNRVRRGTTLVVTQRGEPIAELRPLTQTGTDETAQIEALVAAGSLTRRKPGRLTPFKPVKHSGPPLSRTIVEEREDRL
jgi:prevent-host-death family protein